MKSGTIETKKLKKTGNTRKISLTRNGGVFLCIPRTDDSQSSTNEGRTSPIISFVPSRLSSIRASNARLTCY